MKVGIRKFTPKKRLQARNPITQMKRKYSVKKYTDPIGTIEKRTYNKIYEKTTIDSIDSLVYIVPITITLLIIGGAIFVFKSIFN